MQQACHSESRFLQAFGPKFLETAAHSATFLCTSNAMLPEAIAGSTPGLGATATSAQNGLAGSGEVAMKDAKIEGLF